VILGQAYNARRPDDLRAIRIREIETRLGRELYTCPISCSVNPSFGPAPPTADSILFGKPYRFFTVANWLFATFRLIARCQL
jgi:hypothetical protein